MDFTGERLVPNRLELFELHREHIMRYVFALPWTKGKSVLDASCGCGYGSDYLARNGAAKVTGVDLSPDAISFASDHYKQDNLGFEVMDCTQMSYPQDTFDAICSFETIEHLREPEPFLAEARRILKQGGTLFVSAPNKAVYVPGDIEATRQFHLQDFDLDRFRDMLSTYFEEVEIFGQIPAVPAAEGTNRLTHVYMLNQLMERIDDLQNMKPFEARTVNPVIEEEFPAELDPDRLTGIGQPQPGGGSVSRWIRKALGGIFPAYREIQSLRRSLGQLGEAVLALNHISKWHKQLVSQMNENILSINHNVESLNQAYQGRIEELKLIVRALIYETLQSQELQPAGRLQEVDARAEGELPEGGTISTDNIDQAVYFIAVCK